MKKYAILITVFFALGGVSAQNQNPQEKLEAAIYAENAADIKVAVKAGANPNGATYGGHYLGIAATRGSLKAVRALVESGADVNRSTSGGWTAVMAAADNGHLEVLKYLASQKADLKARTRMGRSVLMRAAYHGQTAVVQYLITKGADVKEADSSGVTALMLAAQQGYDKTVKALLDAGADKKAQSAKQKTALMLARETQAANQTYRADEFKRTIALLSAPEKKSLGKLIGKVFSADGKKLEIRGEGIQSAKDGTKLKIKTDDGEISATVTKTLHTKIKATAVKSGAKKGDAVYLVR
ncbi:MAG: ankyrin repeat domain-containing protein [Turneriella sp.]